MARFLILGAGLVSWPVVEYLARRPDNEITIATAILSEAHDAEQGFKNITTKPLNIRDGHDLKILVEKADIVISLVPPPLHSVVAKACIKAGVHMINASYQSPELSALDEEAKDAGVCIFNEIGLDPGIDHLSAMQIIDQAHAKGDEVETFISWCGGLPASTFSYNPLGYKFSWNPKGALMVLLNTASYLRAGDTAIVEGENLMKWAKPLKIDGLDLECYPNRNSLTYQDVYGISEAKNILRGTLRYQGFCEILQLAKEFGFMDTASAVLSDGIRWKEYSASLNPETDLSRQDNDAWRALDWLGCFSDRVAYIDPIDILTEGKMGDLYHAPINIFCDLLLNRLSYQDGEQDMVVLLHKFVIKKPNGEKYFISSLLKEIGSEKAYGNVTSRSRKNYSAMARTVGYPVAIAAQMISDGIINKTGMVRPVTKDIYEPMLKALRAENITFEETILSADELSEQDFIAEILAP